MLSQFPTLPFIIIFGAAVIFFAAERVFPGRELPEAPGWYVRAVFLNLCQSGIVVLAGFSWNRWLQGKALLHLPGSIPSFWVGFLGWFIGTFIFYWWHRVRHKVTFIWRVCHQIHHSPSRIELLTAFYKHPIEIALDSILASAIMYSLLGGSVQAGAWFNVFAAVGEYFYHGNIRTPHWLGYFIQRPEHHSIHHQLDVHDFNYGDITWWDRLFGTFKDTDQFAERCGFPEGREKNLGRMLLFRNNY